MIKIQNKNMNVVKLMINFNLMMRIIECQSHSEIQSHHIHFINVTLTSTHIIFLLKTNT